MLLSHTYTLGGKLNQTLKEQRAKALLLAALMLTIEAIDQTFGENYAIKNPDLVAQIMPLVMEVLREV